MRFLVVDDHLIVAQMLASLLSANATVSFILGALFCAFFVYAERILGVLEKVHQEIPIDKLRWGLEHAEGLSLGTLERLFVKGKSPASEQVKLAVADCFKRLLGFAMEGEARTFYKKKADEEAIRVFADSRVTPRASA